MHRVSQCLVVQGYIYLQFDMTMNLQAVENDDSQGGERILYVDGDS